MSARRLVACWFAAEKVDHYGRMARILQHTAARHLPFWDLDIQQIPCTPKDAGSIPANTLKLNWWNARVQAAPEGDEVLLVDGDCFLTQGLDDLWGQTFDVAITRKAPSAKFPYNAGVVALRISERSRLWMATWAAVNASFATGKSQEYQKYRQRYGGLNQAALGAIIESGVDHQLGVEMIELRGDCWNCEDSCWSEFNPWTRIVHVKGALRLACLGIGPSSWPGLERARPIVTLWRKLDREANG